MTVSIKDDLLTVYHTELVPAEVLAMQATLYLLVSTVRANNMSFALCPYVHA